MARFCRIRWAMVNPRCNLLVDVDGVKSEENGGKRRKTEENGGNWCEIGGKRCEIGGNWREIHEYIWNEECDCNPVNEYKLKNLFNPMLVICTNIGLD